MSFEFSISLTRRHTLGYDMGSKLFATDMLISEMVIPMTNAFHHGDYHKACIDLFAIAEFLTGFGEGFKEFPRPPKPSNGDMTLEARMNYHGNHAEKCERYYETNYPLVMARIGAYQQTVIKAIENSSWQMGDMVTN